MIITLARKPLIGSVCENVKANGTGGLNIDSCRIPTPDGQPPYSYPKGAGGVYSQEYQKNSTAAKNWNNWSTNSDNPPVQGSLLGRWPGNVVLSRDAVSLLPDGYSGSGRVYSYAGREYSNLETSMFNGDKPQAPSNYGDSGSASRYFKVLK